MRDYQKRKISYYYYVDLISLQYNYNIEWLDIWTVL